jgi:hypothetical protein
MKTQTKQEKPAEMLQARVDAKVKLLRRIEKQLKALEALRRAKERFAQSNRARGAPIGANGKAPH